MKESLPEGVRLIPYLMDLLNLGRESIYRRIRNEIPFTFEEIAMVSLSLNLSIDEIIGRDKVKRTSFDVNIYDSSDSMDIYTDFIEHATDITKKVNSAQKSSAVLTVNYLPTQYMIGCDSLSKFFYYRWIYKTQQIPPNLPFSDFHIPQDILTLHKKYSNNIQKIKKTSIIMDSSVVMSIVKEINYYYRRKLLVYEELKPLRNELLYTIDKFESMAQKGVNDKGEEMIFYLSNLDIDTNSSYFEYDGNICTQFWLHTVDPITTHSKVICKNQKERINSLKRYCTLISQCNEIQQADFFNMQRVYIEKVGKETDLSRPSIENIIV